MIPYTPPLDDIRFILTRLIGLEALSALPGYDGVSAEVVDAVLDEAGKIAGEIFAPLNTTGDKIGAKFDGATVTMPPGFQAAYQAYVDGGWNGMPVDEALGGQGLPWSVAMPVQEMLQAANLSLALCTLLNQGAIELLSEHGDAALKATYLAKMISGRWSGTMNLTEPQAGSDVGAVRCKAERNGKHYLVKGQKIYISYGDHDLTDNIIHFVLARLPDAPEGTRGLSLFLVPKILVNADGTLGNANDVRVVSIEHKLGQHASPTCVMAYGDQGGAIGYLVGKENGGINAMFTMMNNARIGVGIQALGLMDRACQQALSFAETRIQSRDLTKPKEPPVAIIHHPDVQRMLMEMRASIEAARALAYVCAFAVDVSKKSTDAAAKAAALRRVDLLTPVIKAWLTDLGNEVTSQAVQVFGGMGYIEETGAAQHMRDARVLAIYEGTNGIQANDLVFRKLARDSGTAFNELMAELNGFLPQLAEDEKFARRHGQLTAALKNLQDSVDHVLQLAASNPAKAASVAAPLLRLMGNALGGFYLMKSAWLAAEDLKNGAGDSAFLERKIATAQFYADRILPYCGALATSVTQSSAVIN